VGNAPYFFPVVQFTYVQNKWAYPFCRAVWSMMICTSVLVPARADCVLLMYPFPWVLLIALCPPSPSLMQMPKQKELENTIMKSQKVNATLARLFARQNKWKLSNMREQQILWCVCRGSRYSWTIGVCGAVVEWSIWEERKLFSQRLCYSPRPHSEYCTLKPVLRSCVQPHLVLGPRVMTVCRLQPLTSCCYFS